MTGNNIFEKNIKRLIHSAGPALHLPDEKRNQILEKLTEVAGLRAATAMKLTKSIWRIIITSKVTKLAAAAVILIAAIISLHYYTGSIKLTAPAFGEVIKNMQQMKWIYFFKEDLQEGTIKEQVWACPEAQILILTGVGYNRSAVLLLDCKTNRKYLYDAQKRTITVSYMEQDYAGMYRMYVSSPLHLMDDIIEKRIREEAYIMHGKARYNGRDAIIYRFDVSLGKGVVEQSQWVVDAQSHLPIINEVARVTADGKVRRSYRFAFDYPESGPEDIYALGVPRDAKVIDKTPKPDVEEILKTYHSYKDKTLKRYIAIISVHNKPVYIEYSDEAHKRVERYELAINGWEWQEKKSVYQSQMGDTFDSVYSWLKSTNVMHLTSVELYDGIFCYKIDASDMRDSKPPSRGREFSLPGYLVNLGWPRIEFEGNIVEDDYSRANGLICIEQKYNRYYIAPNRGYICQRIMSMTDTKARRDVVEFGQTDSGHWYPRKVSDGTTIYLKENPDFPEGIFEPKCLPNYVEWKKEDVPIRKPCFDSNGIPEYEGFTPLHMAVFVGDVNSVKRLLAEGADVNPKFNSGATPMELAAEAGRLDMVKLLFEHRAGFTSPDGRCALAAAVDGGNLGVLKFMLDNGADVNGLYKNGETALHHAAEQAKTEFVKMLIEYGADVEIRGGRWDSHTPLYAAINGCVFAQKTRYKDYVETAKVLLEAGADVDTKGEGPHTPLLKLCRSLEGTPFGNSELLKLLIEYGADVNINVRGYRNPLILAVEAKNLNVTKILLEAGADPFLEEDTPFPSPIAVYVAAGSNAKQIEQLLWKYMEPKVSITNPAIAAGARRFLEPVKRGDYEQALKAVDLKCLGTSAQWLKSKMKTLHEEYAGNYELFDKILKIRYLMQYPDGHWQVLRWDTKQLPNLENLWSVPAANTRNSCERRR